MSSCFSVYIYYKCPHSLIDEALDQSGRFVERARLEYGLAETEAKTLKRIQEEQPHATVMEVLEGFNAGHNQGEVLDRLKELWADMTGQESLKTIQKHFEVFEPVQQAVR